jgi:nickel-dependent lactate racemase
MPQIELRYGRSALPIFFDPDRFQVLQPPAEPDRLTDVELGSKLDDPIDSERLEDLVRSGETVLFVVSDATRRTACGQVINLLVRRLIANGTTPHEMNVIFATGIHRAVTDAEKHEILTPFIAQRIKTLDHGPRDLMQIVRTGETSTGIPVELNRALVEHDHVVLIGGVTFHYFAGFTGGRKLICPGLASAKTVSATHKLAFDCERKDRRTGVGTALLEDNPVHEAFIEAASTVKIAFSVNTIVNDAGDAVDAYSGQSETSHRAACDAYAVRQSVAINEKRDLVIVSCGGWPYDINMIQAHKALEAASHACIEGGTIILLAECGEGTGRTDFPDWFAVDNSKELAERLCANYRVNGQTAWSLLRIAEKFSVKVVTDLDRSETEVMRMEKIDPASMGDLLRNSRGFILPYGARCRILL